MGGKKQAQRTKNNARPSSSGRSAELLSTKAQFSGFTALKESGFVLPGFSMTKTEDMDSVDTNFQLVFKKMNKKDTTTKIKALQEFAELVSNSDVEVVKAVLPFWPRLYGLFVIDSEHRVREAAHNAHYQLVLKEKKNLAPHLKLLIGPWFTSQYDTYAPAATAATKSFQAAFSAQKTESVIVFCQESLLNYLNDNLLVQTVSNIPSKSATPEEAELKYERVVISSLQGYALYLKTIPHNEISKELNQNIISNSKFWKYAKHKVSAIRSTWFEVLSTFLEKAPSLLETQYSHVVSAVVNNLDEKNPSVLPNVWKCILLVMTTIKDWWTYINAEKLFLPKLWKVLREGGLGNASVIYTNLLPLISQLPPPLTDQNFYNNFFENLRTGLKKKSVLSSRSESTAIVTTLTECLQYVILKNQSDQNLCESLIKNNLLTTIEWALNENSACYKTIFTQTALLVQYWNRNRNVEGFENYQKYCDFFWQNLSLLLCNILYNLHNIEPMGEIAGKELELLHTLHHTVKVKKQKVTFSEAKNDAQVENEPQLQKDEFYFNELKQVAFKLGETFMDLIETKRIKQLIPFLYSIVENFNSHEFLLYLNGKAKRPKTDEGLKNFYKNVLMKWLICVYLRSKPIIDLMFLLFKYSSKEEKEFILDSFNEIMDDETLGWCIAKAYTHPFNQDEIVKNWLHSEHVSKYLVLIAEKEFTGSCPSDLKVLFKLAFTENEDGELLISPETVREVISKLKTVLLNPNKFLPTIDSCSSLASYISTVIYNENSNDYGDDVIIALYTLSIYTHLDLDALSEDTLYEIDSSWRDSVIMITTSIPREEFSGFVNKFAEINEHEFISIGPESMNLDRLNFVIVSFIGAIYKNHPILIGEVFEIFYNRKFVPKWRDSISRSCINAEFLRGNLCSPYEALEFVENDMDIVKYFAWVYLKASTLVSNLGDDGDDDDNDDDDNNDNNDCDKKVFKVVDFIDDSVVIDLIYDLCLAKFFIENYKTNCYYQNLLIYYPQIVEKFKIILNQKGDVIENILFKKCNEGWFWPKAVHLLYTEISPQSDLAEVYENFAPKTKELGLLHLTQLFGDHLNYDHVQDNYLKGTIEGAIVLRYLINCPEIDIQIAEVFGKIEQFRNENPPGFLYERPTSWEKSQGVVEIGRLCAVLIRNKMDVLNRRYWDFGVISLVSWSSNCFKMRNKISDISFQAFIVAVTQFFIIVDNKIRELKEENPKNSFVNEWEDLFLQSIHNDISQLWLYLAEYFEQKQRSLPIAHLPFLEEFGVVVENFNYKLIFNRADSSPKWTKYLKRCCSLLINPHTTLQLWGYKMLLALVPGLLEVDSIAVNTNKPHEKGLIFEQFKEVLVQTHQICNDALSGFKLGEDSCQVKPFTDSFTYIFAYLLLWDVLLTLCEKAPTELHYQYTDWLRKEDLLKNLLNNLFRLMPTEILHCTETKVKTYQELFLQKPVLNLQEPCTSEKIEHLVCWVYNLTLSQLSALVRQWWSATDSRIAQIVEKVTATFVSPTLCNQEMLSVSRYEKKFKNMVVKVIPSVREVLAIYTIDESQMELMISLPMNYPLGGPNVQCNKQIGGTSHKQWLMQLKKCLLHQNGRIWDGLSLWNNNLDKKFDGVEECYICFAVLHPGTYQLPKLSCQTCKKKFHSACLYKWFSTSNKSSCPICRNLF